LQVSLVFEYVVPFVWF